MRLGRRHRHVREHFACAAGAVRVALRVARVVAARLLEGRREEGELFEKERGRRQSAFCPQLDGLAGRPSSSAALVHGAPEQREAHGVGPHQHELVGLRHHGHPLRRRVRASCVFISRRHDVEHSHFLDRRHAAVGINRIPEGQGSDFRARDDPPALLSHLVLPRHHHRRLRFSHAVSLRLRGECGRKRWLRVPPRPHTPHPALRADSASGSCAEVEADRAGHPGLNQHRGRFDRFRCMQDHLVPRHRQSHRGLRMVQRRVFRRRLPGPQLGDRGGHAREEYRVPLHDIFALVFDPVHPGVHGGRAGELRRAGLHGASHYLRHDRLLFICQLVDRINGPAASLEQQRVPPVLVVTPISAGLERSALHECSRAEVLGICISEAEVARAGGGGEVAQLAVRAFEARAEARDLLPAPFRPSFI
mmetsp:Transcript_17206/g.49775  ORF Transcript_17206/g.49775 Transcript_17206/m.49775 type:complete len:420 (+) Transcript_17206:781-2040(+)